MKTNDYPNNLIRAIYNEEPHDATHVDQINADRLLSVIKIHLTDKQQQLIKSRYQENKTYKACGEVCNESGSNAQLLIKKTLRILKRYGQNNYFQIDPSTGVAYTHDKIEPHIQELKLNIFTENALLNHGIRNINQVRDMTESQLKKIRYFDSEEYKDLSLKIKDYEQTHNLKPLRNTGYPYNLLHAIKEQGIDLTITEKNAMSLLSDSLKRVTTEEQQLLEMHYRDQLTHHQCAKRFNISKPTMKKQIENLIVKIYTRLKYQPTKENPYFVHILELNLKSKTYETLLENNIITIEQVIHHSEQEFNEIQDFGTTKQKDANEKLFQYLKQTNQVKTYQLDVTPQSEITCNYEKDTGEFQNKYLKVINIFFDTINNETQWYMKAINTSTQKEEILNMNRMQNVKPKT